MKRLIEKTVFSGLVTAWRLATWPTSRSPSFGNPDDRGRRARALLVHDDRGLAALHDGDDRVGGAEVDADDFALCHVVFLCLPDDSHSTRLMSV